MLLSAKFENIYSFSEETRILFTAGKSDQLPLHVSRAEKHDDISVLRIFGELGNISCKLVS